MVNDEEVNIYKELRERHPKVLYKLKVCEDPVSKNMPHEEEFDDDNYESIYETTVKMTPTPTITKFLYLIKFLKQ